MARMKILFLVLNFVLLASWAVSEDEDDDDFNCHELYEHDATIQGTVSSPFYGKRQYHDELWCEYRIRAPENYNIKVTFKDLDIEPSTGCGQDQLVVYGKDKQSIHGIFCGHELPNPIVSTEGEGEIRLLFRSDYMVSGRGFLIEYEAAPNLKLCEAGYSECTNRNCYKRDKKCDGEDDCGDGTDEEDCGSPGDIKIHLGAHSKFKKTKYEQIRRSARVIAFPDLEEDAIRRYSIRDDISLIKLNAPVKFNEGVQPACFPELGWELQPGWSCYATGWGETRGSGGSDVLKQMEQTIQPRSNCSVDPHSQICVEKRNNSPCHGDSGGPLQCKLGGKWYVFGAASFVTTSNFMSGLCTGPGAMTVYASTADKADWIRKIINQYS